MLHLTSEEKKRMLELSQQGLPLKRIAEQVKEEFERESLSYSTVYRILNEWDFDDDIDEVSEKELNEVIKKRAQRSWGKIYNKKVKDALTFMYSAEEISKLFAEALDWYEWSTKLQEWEGYTPFYNAIVFVWDLHYWRSTENLLENRSKMIKYLLDKDFDEVTLCLMWDLIETPRVTGMHDSQILEMDYLWIDQALWCVDMLQLGIGKLIDSWMWVKILWLNWNHHRMSKERDWDPERIVWCMMYEMLRRFFPDTSIKYSKDWVITESVGNYNLILSHWDNGFNSKSDTQILQALGKVGMKNIIASGHRHTSQMTQGNGYTRIYVPSLNRESEYEKQKFISKTNPWFVVLSNDDDGFNHLQFIWV